MSNELTKFATDNIGMIGLAIGSGLMLLWPMLKRGQNVTPGEAVALINRDDALVLDVREDAEFAMGHIADARHIPLKELEGRLGELEKWKSKPLVVHCQSGVRSAKACGVLRRHGFTRAFNLTGGISAWQEAKLPVTKD